MDKLLRSLLREYQSYYNPSSKMDHERTEDLPKKHYHLFVIGLLLLLSACLPENSAYAPLSTSAAPQPRTSTPAPTPTSRLTASPPRTQTPSPTAPLPTFTDTPAPMPSPTALIYRTVTPGEVDVPILLYHHIVDSAEESDLYSLKASQFRDQMQLLRDWGYTPILMATLLDLLQNGGSLPLRPIIITFDDGNRDVYLNAFPLLQELGYPAVIYVIVKSIGAETNLDAEMLRQMAQAGWEIGSHSYSHTDLTKSNDLQKEICHSKKTLEEIAEVEVKTFAYPYGIADDYVKNYARDCGYTSGAGLGPSYHHALSDIFYFQRLPVNGTWSLAEFASHLPWK
jgi:peptidoglycan/xylan/chitin deacetylase (PgdA/CDA1 family)